MNARTSRRLTILLSSLLGGILLLSLGCGILAWFVGDVFGRFSEAQQRSLRIERETLEKHADPSYQPLTPESSRVVPPPAGMPNLEVRVREGY